jgi:ribosomal protein L35
MIHKKQLENVEYIKYFGSIITNDARRTHENKSKTGTAKAALNKKTTLSPANWI